jgi:dihydropyrimidinase
MDAAKILSKTPALLMGLYPDKGSLLPGSDADIVIVNPEKEWVVGKPVYGRSEYSPYEHMHLKGKVELTISKGKVVFNENQVTANKGYGRFLSRDRIFWR